MKILATLLGVFALLVASTPGALADGITLAQERQRAAEQVNRYRRQVGLPAVGTAGALTSAASGHARYQIYTGELGHFETRTSSPAYVQYGPLERTRKYGYKGTGVSEDWMGTSFGSTGTRTQLAVDNAVRWWMSAIYHRFPIIRPGTKYIGYGADRKAGLGIAVLNFGTNLVVAGPVVRWPRPNATGIGTFVANESPNPLAVCGISSNTMGYPVSVSFHTGTISVSSMTMKRADTGASVAGCRLTPSNDARHEASKSISFVPTKPLAYGARYTVSFKGKRSGKAFHYSWSFTTMLPVGTVVSVSKTSGDGGVALQPTIAVRFSRPILSYTLVRTPYSRLGSTGVGVSLTPSAGGSEVGFTFVQPSGATTSTVSLRPSTQLKPNTQYRVTFAFADAWGRAQRGTILFTTGR